MPELLIHRGAFLGVDIYQQPVMSWCMFKSASSALTNVQNFFIADRELGWLSCGFWGLKLPENTECAVISWKCTS